MRKVLLGEGYEDCSGLVERIAEGFAGLGEVVYDARNQIRVVETERGRWNVKRYHRPALLNRLVYSTVRRAKGLRAFVYPARLLGAGIETPRAIAYVEERRWGLIGESFLFTEQCELSRRFYELGDARLDDCRGLVAAFVEMTVRMHEAGLLHKDYSPGNILFDCVDGEWRFSLVDINRLRIGAVSVKKGCENFARLWGQPEVFRFMAREYARRRGADVEECERWVMSARRRFWLPRMRKWKLPYRLVLE